MPWWTWIALGFFGLALVATAVFALYAFGRLKRLRARGEALAAELDEVARSAEELERRAARVSEGSEQVEQARERLGRSLERLSVLTWALGDARRGLGRLRGAYLRK
jgi:cell division protein FtsB